MSETNELEVLLRRWAELEPDMCERDEEQGVFRIYHPTMRGKFYVEARMHEWSVEQATRHAIEARGWIWHMQNAFNQDGVDCYVAYLSGINEEEEFARDTPAAALLSAYLAALKSVTP